ncbi:CopD family protein [Longispora urticae]
MTSHSDPSATTSPDRPEAWSRSLAATGRSRRLTISDIKQIEQAAREHIPDSTVEYTHIRHVDRRQNKLTIFGAKEYITLRAPTIDQIIVHTGGQRHLVNLRMTCKAADEDGPTFELWIGTRTGTGSARMHIESSWPSQDKSLLAQRVWELLERRNRFRKFYVATMWFLAVYFLAIAAQTLVPYVMDRYRAPNVDHSELTNMVMACAILGVFPVLWLYAWWWSAMLSVVVVLPGRYATVARRLLSRIPIPGRWKRAAAADPQAEIALAGFVLAALATIITLAAWLFPLN